MNDDLSLLAEPLLLLLSAAVVVPCSMYSYTSVLEELQIRTYYILSGREKASSMEAVLILWLYRASNELIYVCMEGTRKNE